MPAILVVAGEMVVFNMQTQLQHVGSSSLTRDQTQAPALGVQSLSRWTTREAPPEITFI